MSDVISISAQIQHKIRQMDKAIEEISTRANHKAESEAEYEKVLAVTILKLKNGLITEFEGQKIDKVAVSVMDKLAKGICWKEKLEMDKAEADYRNLNTGLRILESQLCAYQSIFRYLT